MNANELRIGNYVSTPTQEFFRIDEIEYLSVKNGKFGQVIDIFKHPLTWYIKDLTPIPLTEKLLVDYLGYEPSAFTGLYYDKEGIIDIKVSWDNKFTVYYKNCEVREVEFLHDLQNLAFALTKEELKINEP